MTIRIPRHFPFVDADPGGDWEDAKSLFTPESNALGVHHQALIHGAKYLYGQHTRNYPVIAINDDPGSDKLQNFTTIYCETDATEVRAWIRLELDTEAYTLELTDGTHSGTVELAADSSAGASGKIEVTIDMTVTGGGWRTLDLQQEAAGSATHHPEIIAVQIRTTEKGSY